MQFSDIVLWGCNLSSTVCDINALRYRKVQYRYWILRTLHLTRHTKIPAKPSPASTTPKEKSKHQRHNQPTITTCHLPQSTTPNQKTGKCPQKPAPTKPINPTPGTQVPTQLPTSQTHASSSSLRKS